jgi:hypothetical protein
VRTPSRSPWSAQRSPIAIGQRVTRSGASSLSAQTVHASRSSASLATFCTTGFNSDGRRRSAVRWRRRRHPRTHLSFVRLATRTLSPVIYDAPSALPILTSRSC